MPEDSPIAKSASVPAEGIHVRAESIDDFHALERMWRDLEGRADASFFLTWGWIGCWLRHLPAGAAPRLLVARADGQVVGLAVVVPRTRTRHGFITSDGLFLHETGDPDCDALTIEHNGILADRRVRAEVTRRCVSWLAAAVPDWEELVMSGVGPDYAALAAGTGLGVAVQMTRACPYVDLAAIRTSQRDYLDTRSGNTRYQIRRAMRRYEQVGPLAATAASTADEALAYFEELGRLHQAYWTGRGRPGSFSNPHFVRFHRALIAGCFGGGQIQLLRLSAGTQPFGYLYNLVNNGRVHNYQSGLVYDADGKMKPGIVSHYLAIDYNLRRGASVYDFLAGEDQYKRSLMTDASALVWLVLQRPRLKFKVEAALRALWRRAPRAVIWACRRLAGGQPGERAS
ncbi:MAG: GNAT family N-acetyltransferase [Alphaproteobacteria bacterium]